MQKQQWTRNGRSSKQFQPGILNKMKSKKEVILEAQRDKKKVHFASLMDICHLKNSELEPKFQKYNGRVVLRGDIVKDDSGTYAVFTEKGSRQMTAAKVMDVIARLPDCDGQAADAVSAYTQVKHGERSQITQNSEVRMSTHLDTSAATQMAKIVVKRRSDDTCMGIRLQDSYGKDSSKDY